VKIYLNEQTWKAELESIPAALRPKKMAERGAYLDRMIPSAGSGPGWVSISLTGISRETLFNYFEAAGVACVDVEPADVFFLLGGRNLASLTLTRALEAGEISLNRIEPGELMQVLTDATWKAQTNAGTADDSSRDILTEAIATDDLVRNGLLDRDDVDGVDEWLNGPERDQAIARDRDHQATVEEIGRRNMESLDPWGGVE